MSQRFIVRPDYKVTTAYGGSTFTFQRDKFPTIQVIRLENGFDTATLVANNQKSRYWLSKMDADQAVTIEVKDRRENTYTTIFSGIARFANLHSLLTGSQIELKCDGSGFPLEETIAFTEYGSESRSPTLDTLYEIITTATYGLIPGFVNKLFSNVALNTGYSITADSNTIENITGTIKFLPLPGVPNSKALKTLCDIVQAIKGTGAGPHWIVTTDDKLLVCTLNASHPDAANNGWYKYYLNDVDKATIAPGLGECFFQRLSKEANYILYHGACVCPPGGDYAENNSAEWDVNHADLALSDDGADYKVGSYSLKGTTTRNDGVGLWFWYPKTGYLNLDVAKLSGSRSAPTFSFYAKKNVEILTLTLTIWGDYSGTHWAEITNLANYMTDDKWTFFSLNLKDKWMENTQGTPAEFDMDWTDVDRIMFWITQAANANNKYIWIDGANFAGAILRGARTAGAYSSSNIAKIKVIHDNVAKGDSLIYSDDSGSIARLARAELLRCNTTPLIGWVVTPLMKDLLPGQLLHIHAEKKADGSFNVNKDMRVTKLVHNLTPKGGTTQSFLTDDLTNSYARSRYTDVNKVLEASREYATRMAISNKLGEIDITQEIMENSY